jgi:hypothetical protein
MKKFSKISTAILVLAFVFSFNGSNNVAQAAGPAAVDLGSAGNFVILAKTGISTTGATSVTGDIGVSPVTATAITGFGLTLPASGAFSTSSLVVGKVYAPDYAVPTPANMTTAINDMQTAYTDAAGRASNVTELGAGNIGGLTLAPGVYKWGTGLLIPTNVTLTGGANDVWIFQIAQNLNVSSAAQIVLSGGAQANNVFWVVAGQTTIGTTAIFNGNILDQTAIVLNTGATLNGRALAQTAVTLDGNMVTQPTASSSYGSSSSNSSNSSSSNLSSSSNSNNSSNNPITYMEGCSATTNYSATTGKPCNGSIPNVTPPSTMYNFGSTTLKNGSSGNAVMNLQRFLNAKLNLGLLVDGKFGPKTLTIVKEWQKENGLMADGMVGVKTKAKINALVQ